VIIIGIDPGGSGGIALLRPDGPGWSIEPYKMPDVEDDICELLAATKGPRFAFLEKVGAMPKQGVSSTFKFGQHYGLLRGLLTALQIPREFPTPQSWQKALGCLTKGDKNVSKAKAAQLWPGIKWTHATADAALIAEYGRRELIRTGRI
jgi:crossover junction endodeoxyribonuclease RuvC